MKRFANVKAMLSVTSVLVALGVTTPALAQPATPSTGTEPAGQATSEAAMTAVPAAGIDDIIVTAQRRSENLQKSNLSIQVLGSQALERAGTSSITDLNTLVPGIQIAAIGSTVQISIRGISDNSTNALGNPSVSFNVDGVYVGRSSSISSNFFDIDRIEVLKGPQGTLYGRNASGGAVNLITKAPSLAGDQGYFELEGGNYENKRVAGAFNKTFGSTFALRAAFQVVDRNGYLSDGSNDLVTQAGRLRALWKPSDDFSLLLNFDISHQGGQGQGTVLRGSGFDDSKGFAPVVVPANVDRWLSINSQQSAALLFAATPSVLRPGLVYNGVPRQDNNFYDISAQLDWNLGPATLTVVPAYRHAKEDFATFNGFSFNQMDDADQYSMEARLSNNGTRLKWVVGGYYFDESQDVNAPFQANIFASNTISRYTPKTRAYAGFGEATFSIVPRLRVIGGVRYTSEKKSINGATINQSPFGPPGTISEAITGDARFTKTTWKAGVEFDVAPQSMLYFTASTGFKAGGFNAEVDLPAQGLRSRYNPEQLKSYVVGLRNRLFDNKLQVNLEGFYYDYKDKQESAISFTNGGNVGFITNNAGKAKIKGASADIIFRPAPSDTFHISAEYNDNKYGSFITYVPTPFFNPFATSCNIPAPTRPGLVTVDCSGKPLVKAPKWVGSFGYDHRFTLASGSLTAAVDGQFSSSQFVGTDYIDAERSPSYLIANGSLTYVSASGGWSLTAYVKNVGNTATYKNANVEILQGPLVTASIGDPRTFGARVRFNF